MIISEHKHYNDDYANTNDVHNLHNPLPLLLLLRRLLSLPLPPHLIHIYCDYYYYYYCYCSSGGGSCCWHVYHQYFAIVSSSSSSAFASSLFVFYHLSIYVCLAAAPQ